MFDTEPLDSEPSEPDRCQPEPREPDPFDAELFDAELFDAELFDAELFEPGLFDTGLFKTLRDTAVAATELDVTSCATDELTDAFAALEAARRAIDATRSRIAAHLDATGATVTTDGLRTHNWLAWHHGLPRHDATTLVRTGQFLRTHPDV
ncbi:MAG: hypothetical protein FJW94_13285, partial [Actinobacteria bacterium]|nr:hypothetical protein [Actinomycetota bacterium]